MSGGRTGAYGAFGAWVSQFHRVYGGLGTLASDGSTAGALSASEASRGVHPELSRAGSIVFAWSCCRSDDVSFRHILCHVLSVSPELDVSLVSRDDVSFDRFWWLVMGWFCPW